MSEYVRWFEEIGAGDVAIVGGKNASLGEMFRALTPRGVRVPDGFAVTTAGYRRFIASSALEKRIRDALGGVRRDDIKSLRRAGGAIRSAIAGAPMPDDLAREILDAYRRLGADAALGVDVAVRSSATAEDLPEASFAGQHETFLDVQGDSAVIDACRHCFASLYTDRAIVYRAEHGVAPASLALSIGVQRMVRSDLAAAGVAFTLDTETGFRDVVLVNASWGLGESVVQGAVNPDEFQVFKPTLRAGFRPILRRTLGTKEFKLVYDVGGGRMVRSVPVAPADRSRFCLDDDDVLQIARWACVIEDHYGSLKGRPTPMDIEWAKDGRTGELFVVQARPETVESRVERDALLTYRLRDRGKVLVTGHSVGRRIGTGTVRVIRDVRRIEDFRDGDVIVTERTDPDWEPVMRRAAAIVTDRGGRTCHAAIVSRELGVPAVVGTERGTGVLEDGQVVTVSCAEGDVGKVYEGAVPFVAEKIDLASVPKTRTKVMLIVGNPAEAFRLSFLPNDGVGLVRMEFIIGTWIRAHPMALVRFDELTDADAKAQIAGMTAGYADRTDFFVERLAEGIGTIAAAFHPKDVIVRLSDFKTNEYANLVGGRQFEPAEENPMLGFRGASRYYDARYRDGFALECRALKRVREDMGLANVKVMVPFCRTPEEGRRVVAELAKNGLVKGRDGLEVYVMCEIPSNVVEADAFADVFDGFSIGSNDLTQLVLGIDRDSEVVAHLFDEREASVKAMIAQVIRTAKRRGRKIGLCGQAPSDHPEFAEFLVAEGIDSISLNPDALLGILPRIAAAEGKTRVASAGAESSSFLPAPATAVVRSST